MAWISLAKILLFVCGVAYLVANHFHKRKDLALSSAWTPKVILVSVVAFFISLAWTGVELEIALLTLVKHAKLLEILLLVSLIRTAREARIGIFAFAVGQTFLLMSSWLLAAGVPIPWTTDPTGKYVVFSTYLDQSIMFATTAGVLWHLHTEYLWPRWLSAILGTAALVNVFLLLGGRTGYLVAIAVLSLAITWALPQRHRLAALIATPLILVLGLYLGSSQVQGRLSKLAVESQSYAQQGETDSSSGWRINAWSRSAQAITESPWYGHGVGSWAITVKRLQGTSGSKIFGAGNASNPHQEYLLWGVEMGVVGTFLFLFFIFSIVHDVRHFAEPIQRAVLSVVAAMAVACLFNSALYDDLMGDFFCITLGLLMALGINSSSSAVSRYQENVA
jgi:O-antigen ligase